MHQSCTRLIPRAFSDRDGSAHLLSAKLRHDRRAIVPFALRISTFTRNKYTLCLELNALYPSTPRNFEREKRNQKERKNFSERKKRREVPRVFSALFKSLSLSLSLCVCVCVCVSVSRPSQPPPPRLRAGVRVYKYRATSERGWLRFCAAHPGEGLTTL